MKIKTFIVTAIQESKSEPGKWVTCGPVEVKAANFAGAEHIHKQAYSMRYIHEIKIKI